MKKVYTIETKTIAQVRFYETLYVVKDNMGETIFAGNKGMAERLLRILQRDAKPKSIKRKKK